MQKKSTSSSALDPQQSELSPNNETESPNNPYNETPYPHCQHRDWALADAEVASLGAMTLAKLLRLDELQACNHRDVPDENFPSFNPNVRFGLHMALQSCLGIIEEFIEDRTEKAMKSGGAA